MARSPTARTVLSQMTHMGNYEALRGAGIDHSRVQCGRGHGSTGLPVPGQGTPDMQLLPGRSGHGRGGARAASIAGASPPPAPRSVREYSKSPSPSRLARIGRRPLRGHGCFLPRLSSCWPIRPRPLRRLSRRGCVDAPVELRLGTGVRMDRDPSIRNGAQVSGHKLTIRNELAGHPQHVPALGFVPLAQSLARHPNQCTCPRALEETARSLTRSGSLRFAPSVSACHAVNMQ